MGHVLGPGEGRAIDLAGVGVRFMIDAERTGGGFSLVEHPLTPRTLGSLVHTRSPAGFERYFAEAESLFAPGEPDMEALAALSQRYGLAMNFASVPRLATEHGLEMPPEGELAD